MTAEVRTLGGRMLTDDAGLNAAESASPPPEPQAVGRAASRKFLRVHAAQIRALQSAEQAAGCYSAWLSLALDELDSDAPGEAA